MEPQCAWLAGNGAGGPITPLDPANGFRNRITAPPSRPLDHHSAFTSSTVVKPLSHSSSG